MKLINLKIVFFVLLLVLFVIIQNNSFAEQLSYDDLISNYEHGGTIQFKMDVYNNELWSYDLTNSIKDYNSINYPNTQDSLSTDSECILEITEEDGGGFFGIGSEDERFFIGLTKGFVVGHNRGTLNDNFINEKKYVYGDIYDEIENYLPFLSARDWKIGEIDYGGYEGFDQFYKEFNCSYDDCNDLPCQLACRNAGSTTIGELYDNTECDGSDCDFDLLSSHNIGSSLKLKGSLACLPTDENGDYVDWFVCNNGDGEDYFFHVFQEYNNKKYGVSFICKNELWIRCGVGYRNSDGTINGVCLPSECKSNKAKIGDGNLWCCDIEETAYTTSDNKYICGPEVCNNNKDDDGDGQIDYADDDCTTDTETSCDDGFDNDNDGDKDCYDSDCYSSSICEPDNYQNVCEAMGGDWTDISQNKCCGDDKLTGGYEVEDDTTFDSEFGLKVGQATKELEDDNQICLMDKCLILTGDGSSTSSLYKDIYNEFTTGGVLEGIPYIVLSGFLKTDSSNSQGNLRFQKYDENGDLIEKILSLPNVFNNKWVFSMINPTARGSTSDFDKYLAMPLVFTNIQSSGEKYYSDEAYLIPYSDMGKTNDKNDPTTMCTYIQPDLQTKKWSWKDASTTPFKIFPIGWTIDSISNGTKWFYCNADGTDILRQGELEGPISIEKYGNVPYTPSEEDQMGLYKCSDYFGSGDSTYYFRAGYFCSDCEAYFDSIGSTPDFCNDNDAGNDNNPPCCNEGNCIDNSVCEGEGTGENEDIDTWQCIINPESCFSDSDDGWQNSNCSSHDGVICDENQFCLGGEFVNALDSSSCCVDGTCVDYGELTCSQLGGYVCDSSKNEVCLGNSFGTSDTSQETLTCCNKPCEYFFSDIRNYNRGESFICYNNDNRNLIAECNSGALNNPNRQNFSILNGIYQDNSVFTTGSSLYSIFTNDKVEGSSLLDKSRIISDFNEYYLDGPTNNYILLTTQNSNWSGFDYLEMGVIFNNANINISLVPVKGDEINLGKLTQYAIDKETANYVFVPHHISIKFNETLKQTLKQTRIANINFTNTNTGNTKPTIIIDKIKLTKVNDNNKPQKDYYCSGTFGKWINGLNPPDTIDFNNFEEFGPYMVACKMNFGFDWTGTKCCGYDSSYGEPEYYNDALMGCWGGTPVKNDQTVSNATKSLTYYPNELFYNSNFTACIYDADVTDIDNENIAQACEVKGSHFCSPEAKWKKIFEGTDLGVYYEEDNELKIRTPEIKWAPPGWNWYEDRDREENCVDYGDHEECTYQKVIQISQENPYSNFDSSLDLPLNQNPGKNYESGCCPDDYCWNGTQCVSYKDYLDANVAPIWWDGQEMGYRCTLNSSGVANWELSYQKESYDEKNYGWCPGDTCYYSSSHEPQCVQPGFYDGDPYCLGGIKGNWTRRVFMIAEELLNLTTNTYQAEDYSIYCGAQNDALNNIQGIPNINGACVLNTESNTIFGTSLNQNFSQNFKNILSIYMINASCENKENYDSCSLSPYDEKPTDDKYKVYYDNKTKIIFVSRESITLNPGWFNTFWNKLINLFKSKNPKVTNFKYENFYHIKNNTKTIHAIYKPSKYIQINYSGFEEQTLNLICNQIISETDDNESCKIIGDSIIINTTASQLKNEWIDLTSKTRINIVD